MHGVESPRRDDAGMEPVLQAKSVAPRVSLPEVEANIVNTEIVKHVAPSGQVLRWAVLTTRSGFAVTGKPSASVSPENDDPEYGEALARESARNELWTHMGYALKDRLAAAQDPTGQRDVEGIARMCHEVNRAYCASMGDTSQPAWEDAPDWQKDSARNGVRMHLANPGATPEDSHRSWMAEKLQDGWKWGPAKNPETKEHHCMVPYELLPPEQRAKDYLFRGVVHAMGGL